MVSVQAEGPIPSSLKTGVRNLVIMAVIPILSRILNSRSKPIIIKNIIINPRTWLAAQAAIEESSMRGSHLGIFCS